VKGFGSDSFGGYAPPSIYDKPLTTNNRKEVYDLDRFYDSENSSDDDNIRAKASGLRYDSIGDETSESEEEEDEEETSNDDDESEEEEEESSFLNRNCLTINSFFFKKKLDLE